MRRLGLIALLLWVWPRGETLAHDLQYTVDEGAAVYVRLFFPDGNEFSFESYEVYRAGEEIPFQIGRTDILGRLVFLPDQAGTWRIKAFSEDGHGLDISLTTAAEGGIESTDKPLVERHLRIVIGVSSILGIFGLISLFVRRKKPK